MSGCRYDLDRNDVAALLSDQPPYRIRQVWDGLYRRLAEPSELTDVPKGIRAVLGAHPAFAAGLQLARESRGDRGETIKWSWTLHDGARVETVLMHYPNRSTVCVSTQAGCAMACGFCATGQSGFDRNLSAGEIIEQVIRASRAASVGRRRVSRVVFMGMGEPLANYDATLAAVRRLHADVGISARHLTLSTVGIVPGILRLADEPLPVNLAVSLHAANNRLRDQLVPINRRYPLKALMTACQHYTTGKGRRISLEWALIKDTNDRRSDADELAELACRLGAHVNLIRLNPTPGFGVPGTAAPDVRVFRDRLSARGVNVTVRQTRGAAIDAACGQLAARVPLSSTSGPQAVRI